MARAFFLLFCEYEQIVRDLFPIVSFGVSLKRIRFVMLVREIRFLPARMSDQKKTHVRLYSRIVFVQEITGDWPLSLCRPLPNTAREVNCSNVCSRSAIHKTYPTLLDFNYPNNSKCWRKKFGVVLRHCEGLLVRIAMVRHCCSMYGCRQPMHVPPATCANPQFVECRVR